MRYNQYRLSASYVAFIFSLGVLTETTQTLAFPLPPRLSANGYASDYIIGGADLMLPIAGDRRHNFYLDPNLAYGTDNQGYADLGLGYRWIKNDAPILGLYLFGGYTHIDNNARLWVANPGIEALGSRWDARLNGYITMGDHSYTLGSQVFGPFSFTGHSQVGNLFQLIQYAGNSVDVKFGYQFFPQSSLKGYVGSYFFNPVKTNNIWGGAAGLDYWMDSNVKVFTSYTYDNLRHSTVAFGLGVEFGGTHTERINPTLEERITDPVERYLSELGRGSAITSRKAPTLRLGQVVIANNIAFFSQTGEPHNGGIGLTLENCTFESPCGPTDLTDLGASTLNSLLPNTQMYFNGGAYDALNVPGGTNGVTLQASQSISSRTADYSQPATGAGCSTFNGVFILYGNNALNDIILLSTPATIGGNGVRITGGTNNVITGSQIGSTGDRYTIGLILNASQLNVTNSSIFGNSIGLSAQNQSRVSVKNSQFDTLDTTGAAISGIRLSVSNLLLDNSQITVSGTTSSVVGIRSISRSSVTIINDSAVSAVATTGPGNALTTDTIYSSQNMIGGTLSVTSGGSAIISSGPNITLSGGVTCLLNGVPTTC